MTRAESPLSTTPSYVGRFAPSPTGPLHFGSLVAALGSFLDARRQGGRWLLRIEDVDAPRTMPGAAEGILRTLERFGLGWDGPVIWQHDRLPAYEAALARLQAQGLAYGCGCSRREVADSALARDGGRVYPGTCRGGLAPGRQVRAWRLRVAEGTVVFEDAIQGRITEDVAREVGDFVLRRADGLFAYQLAVVVDDAEAGVTHVVRGADLLDSTPRQRVLQAALGLPGLRYAHLPVMVNPAGEKLSKQTRAPSVADLPVGPTLLSALSVLGQRPPGALIGASGAEILDWAVAHWRLDGVPAQRTVAPPP